MARESLRWIHRGESLMGEVGLPIESAKKVLFIEGSGMTIEGKLNFRTKTFNDILLLSFFDLNLSN